MAYPVSDAFIAALGTSVRTTAQLDVLTAGQVIVADVPIVDGSVTVESNQAIRRHGTITVAGFYDQIAPYGTEVAVYGGLYLPPGTPITNTDTQTAQDDGTVLELVPMGVFGIEEPEVVDDGKTVTTSFEIYDRAKSIQDRRLSRPYPIAAGTNLGAAIQALIDSRRPGLTYNFVTTSAVTPDLVHEEEADPWAKGQEMAAAGGLEVLFDPVGACVLRPIPGVDETNVAWEYVEGVGCQLTRVGRKRTSQGVFSHGIATGETTDNTSPVRGDAFDDDPGSPTYYLGEFGDRPTWLRSPYITSQPQADGAAVGLRNRTSGIAEGITFTALANYAADADDTLLVQRLRIGVNAVYTFDSLTNTLGSGGALSGATRTRRIAS